jgi:small subunit ribosomal protein S17
MKIFTGKVVSLKMDKTATVAVERVIVHPVYKKRYKKTRKYHVQDDFGVKEGEMVKFIACKPYSKLKRWKIIKTVPTATAKPKVGELTKVKTKAVEKTVSKKINRKKGKGD